MSCDFAVWFPARRLTNEQAGELYAQLCEGDTRGVRSSPAVEAFYGELTAKHPDLDAAPEDRVDQCPWSVPCDRSPGHVIMSCVWSQAAYVEKLVRDLARKHGLAVYDAQAGAVTYPETPKAPGSGGTPPLKFW
jgi:hypothetical protein